jgi:hypothetical protein
MSVQPGQHNIDVQRRADYDLSLQFKDSTGANHSSNVDISFGRGRLVATQVPA